jgi:hypothetical protein
MHHFVHGCARASGGQRSFPLGGVITVRSSIDVPPHVVHGTLVCQSDTTQTCVHSWMLHESNLDVTLHPSFPFDSRVNSSVPFPHGALHCDFRFHAVYSQSAGHGPLLHGSSVSSGGHGSVPLVMMLRVLSCCPGPHGTLHSVGGPHLSTTHGSSHGPSLHWIDRFVVAQSVAFCDFVVRT